MSATVGLTGLGTLSLTDPTEMGLGGRFFVEPSRSKNPDKQAGSYSLEARILSKGFSFDFNNESPLQITGTLPLGPTLNKEKEYAFVQFSTGAYYRFNEQTENSEARKDLIGLRPLSFTANWRGEEALDRLLGVSLAVDLPLYEKDSGTSSFSFRQPSWDGVQVFIALELGAVVH